MKRTLMSMIALMVALIVTGQSCVSFGAGKKNTSLGPAGAWVTTENGEAWTQIVSVPTAEGVQKIPNAEVFRFIDDPQDPRAFYWASREHGLLYTYDDGKTWSRSAAPLNAGLIQNLSVHPTDKCTIFVTNARQLYKTTDCARTWTELYREGRTQYIITSVAVNPFNTSQVFAATSAGDLLSSVDGGNSWSVSARFSNANIREIYFDTNKQGLMYLTTRASGLYRSRDTGLSWENLAKKFSDYAGALQYQRFVIYPAKAEQIYWVSKYGILTSRNAGEDWEPIPLVTPPGSVSIYGFGINPRNDKELYYTGTIGDRSTFYRSVDGGITWETRKLPTQQIPTALRVHPANSGWIYLGFTMAVKS